VLRLLLFRTGSLRRFGAGRFLLSLTDDYRACGFTARLFVPNLRRGSTMVFFVPNLRCGFMAFFGEDDDLVRLVVPVARRGRPFRMCGRTQSGFHPVPFVAVEDPAVIIRDVFILIKDVAVLRDRHDFRTGHDDRFFDDRGGRFHDDRLFDDRGGRFHYDRSGTRFEDRPHQVHDVSRKLNAVAWTRVVVIPCEGSCRSEDDRCSESSADNECLVDGLLDRVSYGERFSFSFRRPV